jgi:hypothetical protein
MREFTVSDEKLGITKTFYYDVLWIGRASVKIGLYVNRTLFGKKIPKMFKKIDSFYVHYSYINCNFKTEFNDIIVSALKEYTNKYIHEQYKIETIKLAYTTPSLISKLCQKYNLIDIFLNTLWYIVPILFSILVVNKLFN